MLELKNCPLCGYDAYIYQGLVDCSHKGCLHDVPVALWQSRPIEDALNKQLEDAKELSIEMETIRQYTEFRQQLEIANEKLNKAVKELNVALYTLNQDEATKSWLVPILDILTKETQ